MATHSHRGGRLGPGTLALCGLALAGFAANSLLARQALAAGSIDAASYTLLRLVFGAVMLLGLTLPFAGRRRLARREGRGEDGGGRFEGRWLAGAALATYAAAFSYSYLRIGAALGALVLFPTVKLALLGHGLARGERPAVAEWVGAGLALAGLAVLTRPGLGRPDLAGVALMIAAGAAWAVYTVAGQRTSHPVEATRDNFVRSVLIASPLLVPALASGHATTAGITLAVVSGAVTSALSYAVWYRVVPHLTGMQMGLAQLSVPVLAGLGAVVVLGEALTGRLLAAAALIFAGVLLAIGWRAAR
jgi:drug/metabolite transporter (DMT)-like permease